MADSRLFSVSLPTSCHGKSSMNTQLQKLIKKAVSLFRREEPNLLSLGVHEQAVTHRIAVHLERLLEADAELRAFHVDCEYSNHLEDSKTMKIQLAQIDAELMSKCRCGACIKLLKHSFNTRANEKRFRPDIIVHRRNSDATNKLVVEVKLRELCPFDMEKLKVLTIPKAAATDYGYELGAFIHFPEGTSSFRWFTGGAECV